jgi:hypothetical protein
METIISRIVRSCPPSGQQSSPAPAAPLPAREHGDVAAAVIVEIFDAPFTIALAIFKDRDVALASINKRHQS